MPVITIGRQFGAGGATVGRMLADQLKADFLDSNIIDEVARRLQVPKEEGAAEAVRVKAIMARFGISSEDEARRRLKQTDENWTSYIRQVYGHDRNHPAHYDMVLDTGRLGYDTTVEVVLTALKVAKPIP